MSQKASRTSSFPTGILSWGDLRNPDASTSTMGTTTKSSPVELKLLSRPDPASPQPSIDRLSVTFAKDFDASSEQLDSASSSKMVDVENSPEQPQTSDGEHNDEDEEDYSASVIAIMQRRASERRSKKRRNSRRGSSPFSPDILMANENGRRRSSAFTTSSGDTAISMEESFVAASQEQIFENIKLHKDVLANVKLQPWNMRRKLKLVTQAKAYIKNHEGVLQERFAQSHSTKDMLARCNIYFLKKLQRFKREVANFSNWLIPWELRIKEIESHFGSVVASYFVFLRWLVWVNIAISLLWISFVAIPEMLSADFNSDRKSILPEDKYNSTNFLTLWDFEGVLKYSPMFYGWYTNVTPSAKNARSVRYSLPLAYFFTGLVVYIFSFVATLRKMAENSRMSKLSEKEDECIFSWKLFTGWDYMIGNAETAHNRVASIIMGFKEALVEEAEKKRETQSWRLIGSRVLVNIAVFTLLGLSAFAVITVVARSKDKKAENTTWRRNEITVVMSLISLFFPILFELLGYFEHYHPRKQLRLQLARIMVLNLLNLYSLIFALFGKISIMTHDLQSFKNCYENAYDFRNSAIACDCSTESTIKLEVGNLVQRLLTELSTGINSSNEIDVPESFPANIDSIGNFSIDFTELKQAISTALTIIYDELDTTSSESWHFTSTTSWINSFDLTSDYTTTNIPGTKSSEFQSELVTTPIIRQTSCNKLCKDLLGSSLTWLNNAEYTSVTCLGKSISMNYQQRSRLRSLCWETMFGQELMKLTIMDLVMTLLSTLAIDFFRGLFVRYMNNCWCWDLEKKFPQYGDFKVAENILHLVNNQGMVWMGMFFSPGVVLVNVLKLYILMYLRSWAVLACNVPHEVIFRASRSNNFYYALLLMMLFLCVLPVSYAIVWVEPSWHCGPFSGYRRIFHILTKTLRAALPEQTHRILDYIASPGIVIPLLMLLVLIIYYLISLSNALREANNDLKIQLRRERTEERRKMFQIADRRHRGWPETSDANSAFGKWKKLLQRMPSNRSFDDSPKSFFLDTEHKDKNMHKKEIAPDQHALSQHESLPDDSQTISHKIKESKGAKTKPLLNLDLADINPTTSKVLGMKGISNEKNSDLNLDNSAIMFNCLDTQIPVITISKTESFECINERYSTEIVVENKSLYKSVEADKEKPKILYMLKEQVVAGNDLEIQKWQKSGNADGTDTDRMKSDKEALVQQTTNTAIVRPDKVLENTK